MTVASEQTATASPESLRSTLLARMDELSRPTVSVLLDLNRPVASTHPLHPSQLTRRLPPPPIVKVRLDDLSHAPEICPQLVQVRGPDDRGFPDNALLDLTLQCALERCNSLNGAYVCGWTVSPSPIDLLARQLQKAAPLRRGKRNIRDWFDPHRLALMAALGDGAFGHALLGAMGAWIFVDAAGALRQIWGGTAAPPLSRGTHGALPDPDHWRAQERVPLARMVLAALRKTGCRLPDAAEYRADQALQQAAVLGLEKVEDAVCFALNTLTLSPQWYRHPIAAQLIAGAADAELPLAEAFRTLARSDLDAIAAHRSAAAITRTL